MRWVLIVLFALGFLTACGAESPPPQGDFASESVVAPGDVGRPQVIITGNLDLNVTDPETTAADVRVLVATAGGMVESESASSDGTTQNRFLTLRIPSDDFDAVFADIASLGDVKQQSVSRSDVTAQVVDLDAQIAALEPAVARMKELLAEADTVADVIAAESALAERQARLDGLVAQRDYLGKQVSMSTLYVSLSNGESSAPMIALFFGGALIGAVIAGVIVAVTMTLRKR